MSKFYGTLQNKAGDALQGYRVQVVDDAGVVVQINADEGGTRFTDSAGNTVNYATTNNVGFYEFYWTAAVNQDLQFLDSSGAFAREPITDFSSGEPVVAAAEAAASAAAAAEDATETAADAISTAADAVSTAADAVQTALDRVSTSSSAAAAALASGIYADEATGNAAVADGINFAAVGTASESAVDIWVRVSAGTSTLLESYPNLDWLNDVLQRLSPFKVDLTVGSALYNFRSVTLIGATYATEYYVKYFHRNGSHAFQCYIVRTSDDVVMATVGASGSTIDVTGYTGIVEIDLIAFSGSGITGSITVDFGTGSTFNAGQAAFAATDSALDNSKAMYTPSEEAVLTLQRDTWLATKASRNAFEIDATDDYAQSLITGVDVEGGDPDDTYYINYETYAGIYRVKFHMWSVKHGVKVASWERSAGSDWTTTYPDTVYLTLAYGDSDYRGIGATLYIDWASIVWSTVGLTTYANAAATGILKSNIVTPEELRNMWLSPAGPAPAKVLTVKASGGDFTGVHAAIASLYTDGLTITRSTFPNSDICTPTHPVLIEIIDDVHDEELTSTTISSIDQSTTLVPHGCIIRGKNAQTNRLYMDAGSNTAPVLERPFTCRIENIKLNNISTGAGYCDHIDDVGARSVSPTDNPALQHFRITSVAVNCIFTVPEAHSNPLVGSGISGGQHILYRGCTFDREGASPNTAAFTLFHTSPSTTHEGTIEFENCISNDGDITSSSGFINLLKSHVMTVRHNVIVSGSVLGKITIGKSGAGDSGNSGFIRRGDLSNAATIPTELSL